MVSNGDLRPAANLAGWRAQVALEANLAAAFAGEGVRLRRVPDFDLAVGHHGLISSQHMA